MKQLISLVIVLIAVSLLDLGLKAAESVTTADPIAELDAGLDEVDKDMAELDKLLGEATKETPRRGRTRAGRKFFQPHDVAVSKNGTIYVATDDCEIVIFDSRGKHLKHWGTLIYRPKDPENPGEYNHDPVIALGPDETVYVASPGGPFKVEKYTPDGKYIGCWTSEDTKGGSKDIAVAADNTIYIIQGQHVRHFSADGKFINDWGGYGNEPGQFSSITALAIAPDGSIYICEWHGHRVQQFKPDGTFVRMWGKKTSEGGEFGELHGIAVGPDGSVYVSDCGDVGPTETYSETRIHKFTADGQPIKKWGKRGEKRGEFRAPYRMCVGPDNTLYVADCLNHRIQQFTDDGEFLWELWGRYRPTRF